MEDKYRVNKFSLVKFLNPPFIGNMCVLWGEKDKEKLFHLVALDAVTLRKRIAVRFSVVAMS